MSLFLPLSSADQYHAKPMAISSITSPAGVYSPSRGGGRRLDYENNNSPLNVCPSPSSSSTHSDTVFPPPTSSKSGSSSPPSRSFSNYSASSSTSSFSNSPKNTNTLKHHISSGANTLPPSSVTAYCHPYHHCATTSSRVTSIEIDSDNAVSISAPLSLHERRLRNKTASAKYRAKKNQQHGEMRDMISSLTKENELLLRQLDYIQHENEHLKTTCDRLRGKLMAQKMLKQYLIETEQQQQQQHHPTSSVVAEGGAAGGTMDNNCFMDYYIPSAIGHKKLREEDKDKGDWDSRD